MDLETGMLFTVLHCSETWQGKSIHLRLTFRRKNTVFRVNSKTTKSSCFLCDHSHIETLNVHSCWLIFMQANCVCRGGESDNACAYVCVCVSSLQPCCRRGARSWVVSSCCVIRRTGRTNRREKSPCSPAWTAWSPASHTGQWGVSDTSSCQTNKDGAYLTANLRVSIQFKVTVTYQWFIVLFGFSQHTSLTWQ